MMIHSSNTDKADKPQRYYMKKRKTSKF